MVFLEKVCHAVCEEWDLKGPCHSYFSLMHANQSDVSFQQCQPCLSNAVLPAMMLKESNPLGPLP